MVKPKPTNKSLYALDLGDQVVVINPSRKPKQGELGVFMAGNEAYLMRNPFINDAPSCLGRVEAISIKAQA